MLKLKTTAAACLALSAIGGILAFAIHSAASRNIDLRKRGHYQLRFREPCDH